MTKGEKLLFYMSFDVASIALLPPSSQWYAVFIAPKDVHYTGLSLNFPSIRFCAVKVMV